VIEQRKQGFGQRGIEPSAVRRESPHVISRGDEIARPTFHGSHVEVHWPKYAALIAVMFALGYLLVDGKRDPFGLIFAPVLFGAISYFTLNRLRKALNHVHMVRTGSFRSPAYAVGAAAGFLFFIYQTFISPQMILGVEWGVQTAFADGVQSEDLPAVGLLILKAAGFMVGGGVLFEFVAKRLRGDAGAPDTRKSS
jgi:hypothetical protein